MRLAASSAPVAVKRTAVEPVNKVKTRPVLCISEIPIWLCVLHLIFSVTTENVDCTMYVIMCVMSCHIYTHAYMSWLA
jgi:hypothetical protein